MDYEYSNTYLQELLTRQKIAATLDEDIYLVHLISIHYFQSNHLIYCLDDLYDISKHYFQI